MLKYTAKVSLFIVILLTIVGCSQNNLELTHNKSSKTTLVNLGDDRIYKIDNSKQIINKDYNGSLNQGSSKVRIFKSSGICSKFTFQELLPLGRNMYYSSFAKDDIYNIYKNLNCTTEDINGLEFHNCEYAYAITYEDVSTDESNLNEKRYLILDDKECFNEIKYLAKNAKLLKTPKKKKEPLIFNGTFNTSLSDNKCTNQGIIKFNLNNENVKGSIHLNNNKKISIKGLISANEFGYGYKIIAEKKDDIKITGFMNKKKTIISGTYKRNNCSGRFSAKKLIK